MTDGHAQATAAGAEGAVSGLDARLRGVEGAVSGLDGRLRGVEGAVSGLDGRLRGVEGAVSGLDGRLRAVEAGLTRLDARFGTEMKHVATKADLELHFNRLLRWGLGIMITATGALSALIFGILRTTGN